MHSDSPASARTMSVTRIWPPSAAAQRRAASTTGVPNQSPLLERRVTGAHADTHRDDGRSRRRLWRSTARCMAAAPATASAAPV